MGGRLSSSRPPPVPPGAIAITVEEGDGVCCGPGREFDAHLPKPSFVPVSAEQWGQLCRDLHRLVQSYKREGSVSGMAAFVFVVLLPGHAAVDATAMRYGLAEALMPAIWLGVLFLAAIICVFVVLAKFSRPRAAFNQTVDEQIRAALADATTAAGGNVTFSYASQTCSTSSLVDFACGNCHNYRAIYVAPHDPTALRKVAATASSARSEAASLTPATATTTTAPALPNTMSPRDTDARPSFLGPRPDGQISALDVQRLRCSCYNLLGKPHNSDGWDRFKRFVGCWLGLFSGLIVFPFSWAYIERYRAVGNDEMQSSSIPHVLLVVPGLVFYAVIIVTLSTMGLQSPMGLPIGIPLWILVVCIFLYVIWVCLLVRISFACCKTHWRRVGDSNFFVSVASEAVPQTSCLDVFTSSQGCTKVQHDRVVDLGVVWSEFPENQLRSRGFEIDRREAHCPECVCQLLHAPCFFPVSGERELVACPELAGEYRPADKDGWTNAKWAHDSRTIERWDAMGRCERFTAGVDRSIIVVESKDRDPQTGQTVYRCRPVSGGACRQPRQHGWFSHSMIRRINPDGSHSWDLPRFHLNDSYKSVEHWQRVGDVTKYCKRCGACTL